ncbi:50S ribosomal protein L11 methyltransferase [bacterium]|nr:50S ribosomal protein L11 methyltransferase [candidate division CSSED10-310 bacterium]
MNRENIWHFLDIKIREDWLDAIMNVCWETGSIGSEDDVPLQNWHRVYFSDSDAVENAIRQINDLIPDGTTELLIKKGSVADPGWRTAWHQFFKPANVGEKFLILPSWEVTPRTDRYIIRIHPGQAFGTGYHETTTLCLQHMESLNFTRRSVLDAGCGSGILGIAAAILQASDVLGVDIEAEAVTEAAYNADMNQVRSKCTWEQRDFTTLDNQFDCILGNLQTDLIKEQSQYLIKRTSPAGTLILSGFLGRDRADVIELFTQSEKIKSYVVLESGEWSSIKLTKCG